MLVLRNEWRWTVCR